MRKHNKSDVLLGVRTSGLDANCFSPISPYLSIHALLGSAAPGVDRLLQTQRFVHRALPLCQLRQQLRGEAGAGDTGAGKEAAGLGLLVGWLWGYSRNGGIMRILNGDIMEI